MFKWFGAGAKPRVTSQAVVVPPRVKGPCLLLVEDDPDIGLFLKRWMELQNVRPVLATSVREAMQMVRDVAFIEANFDGLLVDYRLPDATGVRVIQEFLADFPGMPVALMTAHFDISLELWVKSRGIPLFRKPLEFDTIKKWLRHIPVKDRLEN